MSQNISFRQLVIALVISILFPFQGTAHGGKAKSPASFARPTLHEVSLGAKSTAYLRNDSLEELWIGEEPLLCSGSADSCEDCCAKLKKRFPATQCSWRGSLASVDSCQAKLPKVSRR